MATRYLLVSHPAISEIASQLMAPAGLTIPNADPLEPGGRFGIYSGKVPGVALEGRSAHDARRTFREFLIAPLSVERAESQLGRMTVRGITLDGEPATIDINPFAESASLGMLIIGDPADSSAP